MNEVFNFISWFNGDIWSFADALVTIFTLVLVFLGFRNNRIQLQPIKIKIRKNGKEEEVPSYILRKNFARGDIKGILKELHNSDKDYKIKSLTEPKFLKSIFDIQQGKGNELVINITETDFFEYDMRQK